jgi:hypothetical protein
VRVVAWTLTKYAACLIHFWGNRWIRTRMWTSTRSATCTFHCAHLCIDLSIWHCPHEFWRSHRNMHVPMWAWASSVTRHESGTNNHWESKRAELTFLTFVHGWTVLISPALLTPPNKQTNKQTNKRTNKQTNKQTTNYFRWCSHGLHGGVFSVDLHCGMLLFLPH